MSINDNNDNEEYKKNGNDFVEMENDIEMPRPQFSTTPKSEYSTGYDSPYNSKQTKHNNLGVRIGAIGLAGLLVLTNIKLVKTRKECNSLLDDCSSLLDDYTRLEQQFEEERESQSYIDKMVVYEDGCIDFHINGAPVSSEEVPDGLKDHDHSKIVSVEFIDKDNNSVVYEADPETGLLKESKTDTIEEKTIEQENINEDGYELNLVFNMQAKRK